MRRAALFLVLAVAACNHGGGGAGTTNPASVTGPLGGTLGPGGNHSPLISSTPPLTATVGVAWVYTAVVTDPDGDPLTVSLAIAPAGAVLDPLTRAIAWTPTVAQIGSQAFSVAASDGKATTTQPFSVQVAASPATPSSGPVSSGGTSPQKGTFTRNVTTPAQPGLPPITVPYKLLVPPTYDPAVPMPFLVSELTPLTLWAPIATAEGFIVAEQQGYQMNGAWTFDYDVLVFNEILTDVQNTWNVDVKRVYLTGFSAGAHWSYAIGLANADQFAGLGISAGAMSYAAIPQGIWPNQVPRKIAVGIRHGTQDPVVPVQEGRNDFARLQGANHPVDFAEFTGGHVIQTQQLQEIWAFLKDKRRP